LREVFASFCPPGRAASIAQVHRATVAADNRAVAVKVLRPGVERRFKIDIDAFIFVARNAERISPKARPPAAVEVVDTLKRLGRVPRWICGSRRPRSREMAENTKNDPDFRVPRGLGPHRRGDVLTLEWIDATPLTDRARLEAKGLDLNRLAARDPEISCVRLCDATTPTVHDRRNLWITRASQAVEIETLGLEPGTVGERRRIRSTQREHVGAVRSQSTAARGNREIVLGILRHLRERGRSNRRSMLERDRALERSTTSTSPGGGLRPISARHCARRR